MPKQETVEESYTKNLCDICGYELGEDDLSAHKSCETEYERRKNDGECIRCGLEIEGKATTHQECLGMPYIGYV